MAVKLTVIKRFAYRGNATEEWSNTYKLSGATPASSADWRTLFNALVTQEKTVYASDVEVIRGYGYDSFDDDANSVWSVDLRVSPDTPVAGTFNASGLTKGPGDSAAWIRWKLDRHNSNGKFVYLRKYFHPAYFSAGAQDAIATAWQTAANAFGTKLRDGSFLDARKIDDGEGTAILSSGASNFTTTRTLKRRGKRPPT